ncbi:MAG: diphthamide biosynthesis enzyme Dph2 [Nitrososphaerota archaeon]
MSIIISQDQIDEIIQRERPRRIGLQAPDGLINQVLNIANDISKRYGVETIILLDTTWGTCDINNLDARRLGLDLIINIGHSLRTQKIGSYTYLVSAEYDVDFRNVLEKTATLLKKKGIKNVGVVTISNHKSQIDTCISYLNQLGFYTEKGIAEGPLFDGQVFGCNFYSARNISDKVDAFLFLGQSRFHALGVCLSTRKMTFMVDPFFNEVVDITEEAKLFERKAILSIYKAKDASSFGVIMSLKEGQFFRNQALEVKEELERLGRSVQLFSLREIRSDRLKILKGIDAFIETACPRIALDHEDFDKPMLSYQQAMGLIRLLKGQDIGDVFNYPFWV